MDRKSLLILGMLAVSLGAVLWVFRGTWDAPEQVLFSMDSAPLYGQIPDGEPLWTGKYMWQNYQSNWSSSINGLGGGTGGGGINPVYWLSRTIVNGRPSLHPLNYLIPLLLTFLSVLYYCRGIRLPWAAGLVGALGTMLSGYSFTLISAGHIGFFHLMYCVVLMFALVDRIVARRSLLHAACLGAVVVYGAASQPDFVIPAVVLAGIYGVARLVQLALTGVFRVRDWRGWAGLGGCGALALASALVLGAGFFRSAGSIVEERRAQIESTGQSDWIFRTNWSFPPSETIELAAPNIFGLEPIDRERPYWGKLGRRPHNWDELYQGTLANLAAVQNPDRTPNMSDAERAAAIRQLTQNQRALLQQKNFRQHTVYMGIVRLALAWVAVLALILWAWSRRRRVSKSTERRAGAKGRRKGKRSPTKASPADTPGSADHGDLVQSVRNWRFEIIFWSSMAFLCLLLAYGRDFGLYAIWYKLPLLDQIRAPVKYLRFVEIAVGALSAIGVAVLLSCLQSRNVASGGESKLLFRLGGGSLLVIAGVFLVAGLVWPQTNEVATTLRRLGLDAQQETLRAMMSGALMRSALLSFLVGLLCMAFGFFVPRRSVAMWLVSLLLIALVGLDMATVAQRYIHVRDMTPYYRDNPIAARIVESEPHGRTADLLTSRNYYSPDRFNWVHHGVRFLQSRGDAPVRGRAKTLFDLLAEDPTRLWQLSSTRFVVGGRSQVAGLDRSPGVREVSGFDIGSGMEVVEREAGQGNFVLLEMTNVLPRVGLAYNWRVLPETNVVQTLASTEFDPLRELLVSDESAEGADMATSAASSDRSIVPVVPHTVPPSSYSIRVTNDAPAILFVTDAFDQEGGVRVDGENRTMLQCNYTMKGVHLSPGSHHVEFRYHPRRGLAQLALAGNLLLFTWIAIRFAARLRKQPE